MLFGILLAKAAGFFRDIVFAGSFGTSAEADVYAGIFGVVTLIFTGVGTACQTLLIKNQNTAGGVDDGGKRFVSRFILKTAAWLLPVTAVLYLASPALVRLLLPGLSEELFPLALRVVHIMLPSLFFVVIAYIISGALQNAGTFFIPSIVSLPYNALLIAQLLFANPDIEAVSAATTVGWGLHIVFQLPSFYRRGYRFFYRSGKGDKRAPADPLPDISKASGISGVRETCCVFVSNMALQLCLILDRGFMSGSEGAVASMNYASGLFVTVSSVFTVAMSSVIFPSLSRSRASGDAEGVRRGIGKAALFMTAVFVPYLLTVTFFGRNIVSLIWERGRFTAEATAVTSEAFFIYSFAVFGYVSEELFAKVLYLYSKYSVTVTGTLAAVLVRLATGKFFAERYGMAGVAASTAAIMTCYGIFVSVMLRRTVGKNERQVGGILSAILRVLLSGGAAAAVCAALCAAFPNAASGRVGFLFPLSVSAAVYAFALFITGAGKEIFSDMKAPREKRRKYD